MPLQVWINEIHYDNDGTDTGEAIELAGLAGTDLSGWTIALYNGANGLLDDTRILAGLLPDEQNGLGTLAFDYPTNGIQNGSPDGIALADPSGTVTQFLSYEGAFTAVDGPAAGLTSTDIGVAESSSTPVAFSLQLTGTGSTYEDFTWTAPADESFGTVNSGQTFTAPPTGPTLSIADAEVQEGDGGTSTVAFTVTRSGGTDGEVTVDYAITFSGANPADSYDLEAAQPLSGQVTLADGQASETIDIKIAGDEAIEPDETFTVTLSNPSADVTLADASATATIRNDDPLAVYQIQGAGHRSPFDGQSALTSGIITVVDTNGFYLQDAEGDGDAATSDALFVFTGSAPEVAVGDAVDVAGTVTEFTPGGMGTGNLSITEITSPVVTIQSSDNALPEATLIGPHGRRPPTEVIEDDDFASFDPATDGIDFYESVEGMLVTVQSPMAVGATNNFGEIFTVATDGNETVAASSLSERGTVNIGGGEGELGVTNMGAGSDFNPERIQIQTDSGFSPGNTPAVDVGTQLDSVTGVVSYSFGNFEVLATEAITVEQDSPLDAEISTLTGSSEALLVASYNVLNLDPNDADGDTDVSNGQFTQIARHIAFNLNTPDVVALQEVQDNDGSVDSGITAADQTLGLLTDAIFAETGIRYEFIDNPFVADDAGGGQPGANIRTAFLYNPERVDFVEGSLTAIADPEDHASNTQNPFFDSRLPLAASFTFDDTEFTLVNNHFSSKGGSTPLFGTEQLPVNGGSEQRAAQAQAVNDFVDGLLADDAGAKVVVLGDLNEFEFEEPTLVLTGDLELTSYNVPGSDPAEATATVAEGDDHVLVNLTDRLPEDERYSYVFEGNSQSLDHILVSDGLLGGADFDAVHVNAEFSEAASDHDPLLARLIIDGDFRTVAGDEGGDVLRGSFRDDLLLGRAGDDLLSGGFGDDTAYGGRGADSVYGGFGADEIDGGARNDLLHGGFGEDLVFGRAGDDSIDGSFGEDTLYGEGGDDHVEGGFGDDEIAGGTGNDLLYGGLGEDLVSGTAGDDTLDGGLGDDTLEGGIGNDRLRGDFGNDLLLGGAGDDTLTGGRFSADTFVIRSEPGHDTITDFELFRDVIDVSTFGFASFDNLQDGIGSNAAGDTVITVDDEREVQVTLSGIDQAYLHFDHFVI